MTHQVTTRPSGRAELFRAYACDDARGFETIVEVGEAFAFCTCRTFADADFSNRKWQAPQRYYGATYDHGCAHVDAVILRYGYSPQCDHEADAEVTTEALGQAWANGYRAGQRGLTA